MKQGPRGTQPESCEERPAKALSEAEVSTRGLTSGTSRRGPSLKLQPGPELTRGVCHLSVYGVETSLAGIVICSVWGSFPFFQET